MPQSLHDPFVLVTRPGPVSVEGQLPPPICLVDDDGPYPPAYPPWFRVVAAVVILIFISAMGLTVTATGGQWSLLTDADNWPLFEASLPNR